MRLLLASIECAKGELRSNLAQHIALLEQGRDAGCDLVVFPECSLTGAVDPARHPERAITTDHWAVAELRAASARQRVAAAFGIAERRPDGFAITQAFTVDGRLAGVQRKRHLGDGEEHYRAATETAVFHYGSATLGAVICAESTVDFTWDQTHAAGASLVVFCAAPGLTGRRTTESAWRDGFEWWEGAGLADAQRHARRLGVWVAMVTQAGSTEDEDFPGIAALIDPSGVIVDRLPDWQPGTLVVDVPVRVDVEPIRWAVRVLVVDGDGRTLLAQFGDESTGRRWWVPPGGGIEPGEDDRACARRELREELGRDDLVVGPQIGRRGGTFALKGGWFTQYERWYLSRCSHFEVDAEVRAAGLDEGIRDLRWWSSDELRAAGVDTGPRDLADVLDRIVGGDLPSPDSDLGR